MVSTGFTPHHKKVLFGQPRGFRNFSAGKVLIFNALTTIK